MENKTPYAAIQKNYGSQDDPEAIPAHPPQKLEGYPTI